MERNPATELEAAPLPRGQKNIVDALTAIYPRRIYIDDLVDNVYAFDPNGGPDGAQNVVRVQISRLRKMLPPHGWTIPKQSCGRGNQGFYYLEPIANDNVPAADRAAPDRRAAA
ncbi:MULTISPECIES: helix-turn-helix domain-containing protein [unclassified Brucella]|uniref:helix-turn-helix domain-containing protein n=1 Tax=Brucella/Ochrobactrum group TaxID=2826938 RepID=UPI0024BD14C6|nr:MULTISPECIES: helix-turn-helix domain-containing protein [unclassified Brucella]MDX4074645.1 helix-turn-helix domain-containing protein [Brucella sp. NBRC 113783]WHS33233.1 helix-turn-helix domain-containing protein [Brucella sp. NM4]WHT43333.1 helix-turn-helix domain-containing protein [Ochrobactrum sp. SSR]